MSLQTACRCCPKISYVWPGKLWKTLNCNAIKLTGTFHSPTRSTYVHVYTYTLMSSVGPWWILLQIAYQDLKLIHLRPNLFPCFPKHLFLTRNSLLPSMEPHTLQSPGLGQQWFNTGVEQVGVSLNLAPTSTDSLVFSYISHKTRITLHRLW